MEKEYLTLEKKGELEIELNDLVTNKRKVIAEALEYAKSLGDLSENAEYHQAREDQAHLEDRIREIEYILKHAVIAEKHHSNRVEVGSTVNVKRKGEKIVRKYTIVGSEESDATNGKISNESPLGAALLYKEKGNEVMVMTPRGESVSYVIDGLE
jgi:transcription elongation factor GreA